MTVRYCGRSAREPDVASVTVASAAEVKVPAGTPATTRQVLLASILRAEKVTVFVPVEEVSHSPSSASQ